MGQASVQIVMEQRNVVNVMDKDSFILLDILNSLRLAKLVEVQELVKDVRFLTDSTQVVVVQRV